MKYNDLELDVPSMVYSIAQSYAKTRVDNAIAKKGGTTIDINDPKKILEYYCEEYFAAIGYVSNLTDDYIEQLINRGVEL